MNLALICMERGKVEGARPRLILNDLGQSPIEAGSPTSHQGQRRGVHLLGCSDITGSSRSWGGTELIKCSLVSLSGIDQPRNGDRRIIHALCHASVTQLREVSVEVEKRYCVGPSL